jgi:hypothetical protein
LNVLKVLEHCVFLYLYVYWRGDEFAGLMMRGQCKWCEES